MIMVLPSKENEGISPDGLTYTFLLNRDLKWSDEEPVTAQQILDTLISYDAVKENTVGLLDIFNDIDLEQSTVLDDRTLVLKLKESNPEFLTLSALLPFLPIRSGSVDEATYFLSNGPFRINSWDNSRVTLVPNDQWSDRIGNIATYEIQQLEFIGYNSFSDATEGFLNGEVDVVNVIASQLSSDFQIPSEGEISVKTRHITYGVFVNSESTPFSQVESRKALALGLNKLELLDMFSVEIQRSHSPANSWIPEGISGSDDSAGLALSGSKELATDYWARGKNAEGINVELLYSLENPLHAELAVELKKLWEQKLPLQINLRPENAEEYFADLKTGRYQLAIGGWQADYPSAANWLHPFVTDSDENFLNFSDDKYDSFLQSADMSNNRDERLSEYAKAHNYLIEQGVIIPILHPVSLALVRSEFSAAVNTMFDFQGTWTFD
jgi:ABC-type oligopeptide transport system substrate-binding subunit